MTVRDTSMPFNPEAINDILELPNIPEDEYIEWLRAGYTSEAMLELLTGTTMSLLSN